MTLVVNLFAGPGAGKSTTAAKIFADLKIKGVETELAHEYAKDLTWEKRHKALTYQPYITAKQIWRVHRLLGQVDVVVTDSPILLAMIYKGEGSTKAFEDYVVDTFHNWNTLNFLLRRHIHKEYSTKGRNQTKEEALTIDFLIRSLLDVEGVGYHEVEGPPAPHKLIVDKIMETIS